MVFLNRQQAAKELAKKLEALRGATKTIVLALPRGGVVLGRVVADALALPLDIVVSRKIGAESNEEYAIGAITEKGDIVWNEAERDMTDKQYLARRVDEEKREAARRLAVFRKGMPPRDLKDKTVLIVDDGIATGLTIRAAIATVKAEGAKRVIVAVPVASSDIVAELKNEVDEMIALTDLTGGAIAGAYKTFLQVDDEKVIALLAASKIRL